MRPPWARSIPEPVIELLRPLVRPAESDSSIGQRLASVRRVKPAWSTRHRRAEDEIRKLLDVGQRGSYSPGRSDWAVRWADATAPRVLMFAFKDYAGSFYDWAEAINSHGSYSARHAVVETSKFGFPVDLVYPHPDVGRGLAGLYELAAEADLIHVKDEFSFNDPVRRSVLDQLRSLGKPIVFTQYGGYARSMQDHPDYRDFVATFDGHVALTADLAFDWLDATYVPHALPAGLQDPSWIDGNVVAHSPSTPERKGTDIFLAAFEEAQAGDTPLQLDLITEVSVSESVARKQAATLFFDQAGREQADRLGTDRVIGWYGKSAIEAMVAGVPVMAHLAPAALAGAGAGFADHCPILDVEPTVESIRDTVDRFFASTPAERARLSADTAAWVREFHGLPRVAALLGGVYRSALERRE